MDDCLVEEIRYRPVGVIAPVNLLIRSEFPMARSRASLDVAVLRKLRGLLQLDINDLTIALPAAQVERFRHIGRGLRRVAECLACKTP
ncbi:protein of unknown function [Methylocaldum szegediense]|uniref:Uncharacterized protein n=1 Tax=Methylocaldum szegediense TaxID=73780 RepID=A0ABN8X437_9GAMM|nr:protein of unknown function [Methylocaldum szegediense]